MSLGLLALIPLRPFRELAFALAVGILIDAFIVRSLLAPMLLSVLGSAVEPSSVTDEPARELAVPVAREPAEAGVVFTEAPPERT